MEAHASPEPHATSWRVPSSPETVAALLTGLTVVLAALSVGDVAGRTALLALGIAVTVLAGVAVIRAGHQHRAGTDRAAPTSLPWGLLLVLTAATAVWLGGGTTSPLVLVFALVAVVAARATPTATAGLLTGGVLGSFGAIAILDGASWSATLTGLLLLAAVAVVTRLGALRPLGARQRLAALTAAPQPVEHTDVLTGALNHQGLHQRLAAVVAATGPSEPLAVLAVGVDGLKRVNRTHGHRAGDDLLRSVVATLREVCRADDLVSRPGGDVFVVVLAGVPFAVAHGAAERVHDRWSATGAAVTLSIGVGWTQGPLAPAELLERAEEALFAAKAAGRGCTRLVDAGVTGAGPAPLSSARWQLRDDVVDAGRVGLQISLVDGREHADP